MPNTNMDILYPELFTATFDSLDVDHGYVLHTLVHTDYKNEIQSKGKSLKVPVPPAFKAKDYIPGDPIFGQDINQQNVEVILNKSKSVTFALNDEELSLSPYKLVEQYGKSALEALLEQVNLDIAAEFENCTSVIEYPAGGSISKKELINARTMLNKKGILKSNRYLALSADYADVLLNLDDFSNSNKLATESEIKEGIIANKYSFKFVESNALTDAIAFHRNSLALVARAYQTQNIQGKGVQTSVGDYKGLPIRVSLFVKDLVLYVQFDILYGIKLISNNRAALIKESA